MRIYQEMKNQVGVILLLFSLFTCLVPSLAQPNGNYVKTVRMLDSLQSSDITTYQFYDGWGRPFLSATDGYGHERQLCLYPPVLRCSGERPPTVASCCRHILHTAADHKHCVFHVIVSIRRQLRVQLLQLRCPRTADRIHQAWNAMACRKQDDNGFLHCQRSQRQHIPSRMAC